MSNVIDLCTILAFLVQSISQFFCLEPVIKSLMRQVDSHSIRRTHLGYMNRRLFLLHHCILCIQL
jgi:hypothetical protein